ncbi:LuxR C-terminal-related transcriptional regulator [Bacteroidales bacterium OttesenSCG-928-A17]|nr:LuxR C-terminal-related transcriptional regulator [Bacteroidales bacterium OttesenSCG-928-A17]
MAFLSYILITILIGWWLATTELSAGFSGFSATEVVRGRYLGLIIIFSLIIGGCGFSGAYVEALNKDFFLPSGGSAIIVTLSASLAVLLNFKLSKFSSIVYALMGAFLGWDLFCGKPLDFWFIGKCVLIWLLVPVLSGLIASLFYRIYRFFIFNTKTHLLVLIRYLRVALLIIAIVFAICIGINNGSLLIILNKTLSYGFDFSWNGIRIGEEYILFVFSVILVGSLAWSKTTAKINEMAEGKFDVNIEFILIVLAAGIVVLAFFSIPSFVQFFGLPVTPLSITGIVLGGFLGINLVRGNHEPDMGEELRMMLSTLTTPVVALIISFSIFSVVDTKTFLSRNINTIDTDKGIINLTPILTVLLALILLSLILLYLRKQQRSRMQAEIISLENQNKLFENQKAMTTLEIRTVVSENENLNTKLELRRKELINVAISISEQKKFQEDLYNEIKLLKEETDIEELKTGIRKIEKQLLQKLNYSQELESFYSEVENIHKDFNLRLLEKFPNLTEQERRLVTLLRLGFSSKHIASLMNIAPKSVEISRYRLRTKMGLKRSDNLIQFIKLI